MKKYILIFLSLFFILLIPKNVFALTLPQPNYVYIENKSFQTNATYITQSVSWYDIYGWAKDDNGSFYVGDYSSRQNFGYSNICTGKEISLNVTTIANYAPFNFFPNQSGNLILWNGSTPYTCSLTGTSFGGNVATWACYGLIPNSTFQLTFESIEIPSNDVYGLAIGTNSSYTCDSTNSDAINQSINNTQNIINNNNTNTQSIINNQNQNAQAIINNITDGTPQTESESSTTLDAWKNLIPTNGVVSSLFLIPVNLIDKLVSGFNGTCQTFNLGNLMGTDLVLPCIQPVNFFGTTLWGIIDLACCGMMLFSMFKKFVKVFSDITNLRDTPMNELYGGGR